MIPTGVFLEYFVYIIEILFCMYIFEFREKIIECFIKAGRRFFINLSLHLNGSLFVVTA